MLTLEQYLGDTLKISIGQLYSLENRRMLKVP